MADQTMNRQNFRADSTLNRLQTIGHARRTGHHITGYYVEVPNNPGILRLVRICCNEHESDTDPNRALKD